MRPAGGYTPDMIDFAHSCDVYKIWADMVTEDKLLGETRGEEHWCAFASRKDMHTYEHSHEEVLAKYGSRMVMCERMPDALSAAMGNQMYTALFDTEDEVLEFGEFVHKHAE